MIMYDEKKLTNTERVEVLRRVVGGNYMSVINDALSCYFRHPDEWPCDEDGLYTLQLLKLCDAAGVNSIKTEFDPLRNGELMRAMFVRRFLMEVSE